MSEELASAGSTPLVVFDDVSFWYEPSKKLLAGFTWRVERGETWSILGPSGCGKSTLLHLIAGLRQPQAGRVLLDGEDVRQPGRNVGLMLQEYGLLNWYTSERNVELGLQIRNLARAERQQRVDHWLRTLAIDPVREQFPLQLSGGQRQRVALARVLALQAPVQLLDEPLSAVDELTRERLQTQLYQLNREMGATTLIVTHSVEEAVLLSDKILVITEYAPITGAAVQPLPFASMPDRSDPQFVAICREIRQLLAGRQA